MEYMDIVNDLDEVIGTAPLSEIYEKKHLHRIVHILIFNDQGEIALQMRSKEKSFCPLHWSTSVGGHVQAGESYEAAGLREMREEAGISAPLTFLGADRYDGPGGLSKFFGTFRATHGGPFDVGQHEVDRIEFFPLAEVWEMMAQGEKINPELLFLLKKYCGIP